MKRYKRLFKKWVTLREELRLSDLAKSAGMSNFTKKWRKDRTSKLGAENKLAVIVDVKVNKSKDHVTYQFFTAPTDESSVNVVNTSLGMNGKKSVYTMKLRILDFFKWADTKPGYSKNGKITRDELLEIMNLANIQVFCNCPSFHFQSMNYYISTFNGSVHPTGIAPTKGPTGWGDRQGWGDGLICKHLGGLINGYKFWLNPMASMLNSELKNTNK